MQKASKSVDFRVPLSVCTMFNVLMDAKKQCSKLCVLDTGQEVSPGHVTDYTAPDSKGSWELHPGYKVRSSE